MKRGATKGGKKDGILLPTCLKIAIIFVFVLITLCGAGLCVTSIFMKVRHNDLSDDGFHIWIGVPLILLAAVAFGAILTSQKIWFAVLFTISLLCILISTYGSITSGVLFHENNWRTIFDDLNDGNKCDVPKKPDTGCFCDSDLVRPKATKVLNCGELKDYARCYVADIALSAISAFLSMMMSLFAMSAIWCEPWAHISRNGNEGRNSPLMNPDYSDGVTMTGGARIGTFNGGFS